MLQSLEKIKKMIEAGSHYEAQQVSRHVANMGVQSENLSHHHVGWTVEDQVT
jgi:flagellar biosynthesis regulator FlbT